MTGLAIEQPPAPRPARQNNPSRKGSGGPRSSTDSSTRNGSNQGRTGAAAEIERKVRRCRQLKNDMFVTMADAMAVGMNEQIFQMQINGYKGNPDAPRAFLEMLPEGGMSISGGQPPVPLDERYAIPIHPPGGKGKESEVFSPDNRDYHLLGTQMMKLFESERPSVSQRQQREQIATRVLEAIRRKWPRAAGLSVEIFGSSVTELDGTSSDVDLVLLDPMRPYGAGTPEEFIDWDRAPGRRNTESDWFRGTQHIGRFYPHYYDIKKVADALRACGHFTEVKHIYANVSICKFRDRATGLEADLNINERFGLINSKMIRDYCNIQPDLVRPLIYSVKRWLKLRDLNDPSGRSGLVSFSSYAIALLVINYLQRKKLLPNLQHPGMLNELKIPRKFMWRFRPGNSVGSGRRPNARNDDAAVPRTRGPVYHARAPHQVPGFMVMDFDRRSGEATPGRFVTEDDELEAPELKHLAYDVTYLERIELIGTHRDGAKWGWDRIQPPSLGARRRYDEFVRLGKSFVGFWNDLERWIEPERMQMALSIVDVEPIECGFRTAEKNEAEGWFDWSYPFSSRYVGRQPNPALMHIQRDYDCLIDLAPERDNVPMIDALRRAHMLHTFMLERQYPGGCIPRNLSLGEVMTVDLFVVPDTWAKSALVVQDPFILDRNVTANINHVTAMKIMDEVKRAKAMWMSRRWTNEFFNLAELMSPKYIEFKRPQDVEAQDLTDTLIRYDEWISDDTERIFITMGI